MLFLWKSDAMVMLCSVNILIPNIHYYYYYTISSIHQE